VLEDRLHLLGRLRVARKLLAQKHGERRRLWPLGDVDDLLEARHAERDVLGRHAGVVEGVERHLRGGLADRLRGQSAHHLARLASVLQEARLHLAEQPVEGLRREAVLDQHALGGELRAQQREEVVRRVVLRLDGEGVGALDDDELVEERAHLLDDVDRLEVGRLGRVHRVEPLRLAQQPVHVDGRGRVRLALGEGAEPRVGEEAAVLEQLLELLPQLLLGQRVALELLGEAGPHPRLADGRLVDAAVVWVVKLVLEHLAQLVDVHADVRDLLVLQPHRVHPVLAVQELEHLALRVAHRAVVLDRHALHRLDEPPLDVARLGGLDGGVNQALAAAHRVEEELLRGEAAQVRVLDEAARLGPIVVLGEVRQRPVEEAVRDALALDVLLADAGDHLRDVDEGPLRAGGDHVLDVVGLLERLLRRGARLVARLVEHLVDVVLKRLEDGAAGLALELVVLRLLDELLHLPLGVVDGGDDVVHRLCVGDRVADADRVGAVQDPVVDEPLVRADEGAHALRPKLVGDGVDHAARAGAERLFVEHAAEQLPSVDDDARVARRELVGLVVGVAVGEARHREVGQDEGLRLLARPERLGLEDGGHGKLAGEGVEVHHQVHHHVLAEEGVALGEAARAEQGVLHDAHHGLVGLGRDDAARDRHDLGRLRARLHGLHHVQVHLVAVEVGVVRRRHGEVEAEGGVGHDLDPVRHDGHLVQRRLPVEHDDVPVLDHPLHLVAVLEVLLHARHAQVEPHPVGADDVPSPWQLERPVVDQLLQPVDVEGRDDLGVRQVAGNGARDANLVDGEVRVAGDDRARGEVDALPHQVAAHAPLLALEPLRDGLERAARAGGCGLHAGERVCDQGGEVVLQEGDVLQHDVVRRAVPLLLL